jgi:integrase/recombinase XerD
MLETIIKNRFFLERHLAAPVLEEREEFLSYLRREGVSQHRLQTAAAALLQVIRSLRLTKMRDVRLREIQTLANDWKSRRGMKTMPVSYYPYFIRLAKRWFRFHARLKLPRPPAQPFGTKLDSYVRSLGEHGFSTDTIRGRTSRLREFLRWFSKDHRGLETVRLAHVDRFLEAQTRKGWSRGTLASAASALKSFFQYAEDRRWCSRGVALGIKGPSPPKYHPIWNGPTWRQVRQLLRGTCRSRPADIRARAAFYLIVMYGLRGSEVRRLLVTDLDWKAKTLDVSRSKRGGFQRFPLHRDVADSVLRYITKVRPACSCPQLFVTLHPPFRPIAANSLWALTSLRLRRLRINCYPDGPHSLRHACATRLLANGASLKEISDFLGHKRIQSAKIYAKCDMKSLRQVADFDLDGVL